MNSHTLILNSWMAPHRVVPWQVAMVDFCNGKIQILEEYDEVLCERDGQVVKMPAVAMLKKVVPYRKRGVKFSRENVFARDNFMCCYCGTTKSRKDLNYDHVVPRRQGGKTVWENIVTSCYPCNGRKAGRTPAEAGMKLKPPATWKGIAHPHAPKTLPLGAPQIRHDIKSDLWEPFLVGFQQNQATG